MRIAGVIQTIFIRELVRLADWLTNFEATDQAYAHASMAMGELFRQAAYLLPTTEGPWQRLYELGWQYNRRDAHDGPCTGFQDVAATVPRPFPDHARELCWAYCWIVLQSAEQDVPISQVIMVMKAIAGYEFVVEDVFSMMSRLDDDSNATMVIDGVIDAAEARRSCCPNCHAVAAQLQLSETEKTEKWLDGHLL